LRSRSRGRKARRGVGATRRQRDRRRWQRKRARSTRRCAAYPDARRRRFLHRLFARFRQLQGPGPLPPGINFEKPGAVIAAGQAVADAADGELLVANAHNGLSHPFAAAIVVDGVDIITTSPRRIPCTKPNRRTPPRVNEEAGRLARSRQQEYVFGCARKAKTGVVNVPRCGPLGGIR